MRKTLFFGVVLLSILYSCNSESENSEIIEEEIISVLKLSGTIDSSYHQVKMYQVINDELEVTDSVLVVNNKFQFEDKTIAPQMIYLSFDDSKKTEVFVDNSVISILVTNGDNLLFDVSGANLHAEWVSIKKDLKGYNDQLDSMYTAYMDAQEVDDQEMMDQIDIDYSNTDSIKSAFVSEYINNNPSSYLTPYIIAKFKLYSADLDELNSMKEGLGEEVDNSIYLTTINSRILDLEKTKVGIEIQDFSQEDKDGNLINISDLSGQYVLIDFWASWCGPCRGENPNVVEAYKKYNKKGFTVLGVSLDTDREKWLQAIKDDHLDWQHVSDLKGWKNEVADEFGVKSIPFSILIDPEGNILGKNLRDEELQTFLADLFGEK
jgi:peroxiredoxin